MAREISRERFYGRLLATRDYQPVYGPLMVDIVTEDHGVGLAPTYSIWIDGTRQCGGFAHHISSHLTKQEWIDLVPMREALADAAMAQAMLAC